jgi:hypothetical protein
MGLLHNNTRRLAPTLIAAFLMALASLAVNAGEANAFIGKRLSGDEANYKKLAGFSFTKRRDPPLKASGKPKYLIGEVGSIHGQEIFLLGESEAGTGRGYEMLVTDAIDIPQGLTLMGTPIQDECVSKRYPDDYIFVIGKWANRKSKTGRYAGGYARSISKAWRVDFEEKKLREISPVGIKCEDNRPESDFD